MSLITRKMDQAKIGVKQHERMRLSHYLFLLFWLLKPFYIFPSGSIQPSDAVFLLSFIVWMIEKRGNIQIDKGNQFFAFFVGSVFIVNITYTIIYRDVVFIEKSMYYLYSMLVIVIFQEFANSFLFLRKLLAVASVNILIQLLVFGLGLGKDYSGYLRYMGTFNDPNQLSFFLFSSFLLIYLLMFYLNGGSGISVHSRKFLIFGIVLFLIFQASSTGALLGVITFLVTLMLSYVTKDKQPVRIILKLVLYSLLFFSVFYFITLVLSPERLSDLEAESFLFQRMFEKIGKVSTGGLYAIVEERQISRLLSYPINLIYGAGEGLYDRFVTTEPLEIHSTIIALWFYYGLVPIALLFIWIRDKLNGLPRALYPIYLGLLFESMILANQRQPILWMLIVLGSLSYNRNSSQIINEMKISRRI